MLNFNWICLTILCIAWWSSLSLFKAASNKNMHSLECQLVYDCFHTTAKCVFWILIRDAHFELNSKYAKKTVCMPNHVAKRNLKCASQITVQRCFPVTILANHATKSVYEWLDLRIVFWGAELVWPSNHFHL